MRRALSRLSPLWQVQRRRHPAVAARMEDTALALTGRAALVERVRTLAAQVAELERDHALLAAHVATLTERLGRGEAAGAPDDEGARSRARLAAVAFYEQRIGALEQRADEARHGRAARGRMTIRRASGERREAAR